MSHHRSAILACVSSLLLLLHAPQPCLLAQEQPLPSRTIVRSEPTRIGLEFLDTGNPAVAIVTVGETVLEGGVRVLPGLPVAPGALILSGEVANAGAAPVFVSSASPLHQEWLEPGGTLRVETPEEDLNRHQLSCTCKCGATYVAADDSAKPCGDLEGAECITKGGKKDSFEDCGIRYIDVSAGSSMELEVGRTGT